MSGAALGKVYLIPTFLDEENLSVLPGYILDAVKDCKVLFIENERTSRRYLKQLWKEVVIDDYEWHVIHKAEEQVKSLFKNRLQSGLNIGIMSEAGCPGIADPGQLLVETAHGIGATVKPLVGPSAILLALMASGMNGQQFHFRGYLPIEQAQLIKVLKDLENESAKKNCTQIFMETPYRNNQLLETIFKTCQPSTRLCVAVDITGKNESVRTKNVGDWKKVTHDIHKRPAIFCLLRTER